MFDSSRSLGSSRTQGSKSTLQPLVEFMFCGFGVLEGNDLRNEDIRVWDDDHEAESRN